MFTYGFISDLMLNIESDGCVRSGVNVYKCQAFPDFGRDG